MFMYMTKYKPIAASLSNICADTSYILHMVESKGRATACVFQGLSRESLVVAVDEAEIKVTKHR